MISEARAILDTDKIKELTQTVIFKTVKFEDEYRGCVNAVMCASSLAYHGLLVSVDRLWLCNVDLSPVPAQHLSSLVSCVSRRLHIQNVSGCDLVSILDSGSVKCDDLTIRRQSLGREETQALVQAMESGVEVMVLWSEVTLDIEALAEYSGQGECKEVVLIWDTRDRYRREMKTWARSKNWIVSRDTKWGLNLERDLERAPPMCDE